MRVICLYLLVFIHLHSDVMSQTKLIDSFLGIKFGTSQANTVAAVKSRGGKFLLSEGSSIAFTNLFVTRHKAEYIGFRFHKGLFSSAIAIFDPGVTQLLDQYASLHLDLTDVYGPASKFNSENDDSVEAKELNAMGINVKGYSYSWRTTMPNKKDNLITLQIRSGKIRLEYEDTRLTEAKTADLLKDL